ncbi:hypothetical protein A2995_01850 [Candidatus Nomurabacteria bacterium RIFCSPLOWO2_01_FULL_33_24]|uniref:Uncharacterized protein n=1 Tax=Candidatus Nomurabacteria bacterium RIFCSPLOWO2_01_FULL_33_24 TaxID=1801765 RepID=A0A1F6X1S4_9BACT|nr:MAG: hypothetical protein A2995_01850 [Candidatus Nomurabacteria bacterium RIFCSPLOWO2_01_FULL_33_24]
MKEDFEKGLNMFHKIAKGSAQNTTPREKAEINLEKDDQITEMADFLLSKKESQEEIYEIQKKKEKIVRKFKLALKSLDDNKIEKLKQKEEEIMVDFKGGKLITEEKEITLGELVTDGDWGIKYYLGETIPRIVKKEFLLAKAKREILLLLNDQIIINELSSPTDELKKKAYRGIESREENNLQPGIIAERMVKNLIKKETIDKDIDFRIIEADVYQDVEEKIDFIIKRKNKNRGVGVQASNVFGIQFTINTNEKVLERKKRQIRYAKYQARQEGIGDIILVNIPINDVMKVYNEWQEKKSSGGPDKLWKIETKKKIFKNVLKGILSEEEINQLI